ncbi:unnamed protein product [Thlaspi arvense]|uniref:HORMA domain-containing protein n=1 Tax=Thlaspi arvense TaxID=13288 RepID=A0AAU9RV87_THLAR|nr:unnamed protein product [Thlaspi arvense]
MVRGLNPKKARRKNKKKRDASSSSMPARVWKPGVDKLEDGEELQCDPSAYGFHVGRPCLSSCLSLTFPKTAVNGEKMMTVNGLLAMDVLINRILAMPQNSHICVSWADSGHVQVWDMSSHLNALAESETEGKDGTSPVHNQAPSVNFSGHRNEGYAAIDWSPATAGRLLSVGFICGSCVEDLHSGVQLKLLCLRPNSEESEITEQESLLLTRDLLRAAIFNISYVRGLFPEMYFSDKSALAFERDIGVNNLMPMDAESRRLIDWMEKGVYHALKRKYLKTLMFCICESETSNGKIIEEYTFSFGYSDSDSQSVMMNINRTGNAKHGATLNSTAADITPNQMRSSASKMVSTLGQLMKTLGKMPDERAIVMKLQYHNAVAPPDYEPPLFRACAQEEAQYARTDNPLTLRKEVGNVNSKHLVLTLKVKSVLDPCGDKNVDMKVDDDKSTAPDSLVEPSTLGTLTEKRDDADGEVDKDDTQLARVKDWIHSRHHDTLTLTDVLSNFPDISLVRSSEIMDKLEIDGVVTKKGKEKFLFIFSLFADLLGKKMSSQWKPRSTIIDSPSESIRRHVVAIGSENIFHRLLNLNDPYASTFTSVVSYTQRKKATLMTWMLRRPSEFSFLRSFTKKTAARSAANTAATFSVFAVITFFVAGSDLFYSRKGKKKRDAELAGLRDQFTESLMVAHKENSLLKKRNEDLEERVKENAHENSLLKKRVSLLEKKKSWFSGWF